MRSVQEVQAPATSDKVQAIFETSQKAHRAMTNFSVAMHELVDAVWDLNIKCEVEKAMSLYSRENCFRLDAALAAMNRACWVKAIKELDIAQFRKERLVKMYDDERQQIPCFWFEGPECLQRLQSDPEEAVELEKRIKERLLNPSLKSSKNRYATVRRTFTSVQQVTRLHLFSRDPSAYGVTGQEAFHWLEDLERLLHQKAGAANCQEPLAKVVDARGNTAPMILERAAFSIKIYKNCNAEIKIKQSFLGPLNGTQTELNAQQKELHKLLTEEMPEDLTQALSFLGEHKGGQRYSFSLEDKQGFVWSFPNFVFMKLGDDSGVKARGTAADRFRGVCEFLRPSPAVIPESTKEESTPTESGIGAITSPSGVQEYALLLREFLAGMPTTPILSKSSLCPMVDEINRLSSDLLNSLTIGNLNEEAARVLIGRTLSLRADVEAKRTAANEKAITCALIECQSIERLGQAIEEILTELVPPRLPKYPEDLDPTPDALPDIIQVHYSRNEGALVHGVSAEDKESHAVLRSFGFQWSSRIGEKGAWFKQGSRRKPMNRSLSIRLVELTEELINLGRDTVLDVEEEDKKKAA